ncbi:MAG: restriction endonuclease subunit S [Deltaproteobacteria bacterium]|mgnify:CR=1 FL=1|nr:restriction endonuclease subunit S [Deltaproteobacteria bacterium]
MARYVKWPTKRLCELAEFRNGVNYNKSSFGVGVKVVGVSDFQDYTRPRYAELAQINPDGIVTDRNILRNGDIVFVRSNGNRELIGRSLFIENPPEEITHSAFTIRLRFSSGIVFPKFYAYCFRTPVIRQALTAYGGGTNISNLNQDILNALEVPFPPLPTQQKIAAILSVYDDLIENNLRRIKILEEMSQNLYREWFVKFRFPGHEKARFVDSPLGKIPEGWEVTTINAVTSYINRGVTPKYDDSSTSLVINQKCIRDHKLNLIYARPHRSSVVNAKYVQFGDVLINSTGVGTLGRVTQVYEVLRETTVDTHVSIVRPACADDIDYFGLTMIDMESHFESLGAGATGQTELRRDRIGETEIILPPSELRKQFSEHVTSCRKMILNLLKRNVNLRLTRDLLLPKLVSGEVDVSELGINIPEENKA